jgi:hypothetical protein
MTLAKITPLSLCLLVATVAACQTPEDTSTRSWIAGDHHIHSRNSVGWDNDDEPPSPIRAGDGIYAIAMNATMARRFGLSWMVATDHGGPNHSKVSLEWTYPDLQLSREAVPEVVQFFGMEFDTPAADHTSLIIPHTHDEAERLVEIEARWAKHEAWPRDPERYLEPRMLEALAHMRELEAPPILIANHPSRSASAIGVYGQDTPAEFRNWNNTAPDVAVGMAAAPGHQAVAINPDGSIDPTGPRGWYEGQPTLGGFDQMTARLGGFWDSMLGEGRRWWVTANSDSHVNWREGGGDFWPGEYSKTYVFAEKNHQDIIEGIRGGRVFVTTGDLVSEVWVTAATGADEAHIGGQLNVASGDEVEVTVRFLDPAGLNSNGGSPAVRRLDVIVGEVNGHLDDPTIDTNPTTRVLARFTSADWSREGDYVIVTLPLPPVDHDMYLRVRGTNSTELEPENDPQGEDPWTDLWFYSNPIFIELR